MYRSLLVLGKAMQTIHGSFNLQVLALMEVSGVLLLAAGVGQTELGLLNDDNAWESEGRAVQ